MDCKDASFLVSDADDACMLSFDNAFQGLSIASEKKRKVYAGRHGLWEVLDRPMASRPVTGGLVRGNGKGEGGWSKVSDQAHAIAQ